VAQVALSASWWRWLLGGSICRERWKTLCPTQFRLFRKADIASKLLVRLWRWLLHLLLLSTKVND